MRCYKDRDLFGAKWFHLLNNKKNVKVYLFFGFGWQLKGYCPFFHKRFFGPINCKEYF